MTDRLTAKLKPKTKYCEVATSTLVSGFRVNEPMFSSIGIITGLEPEILPLVIRLCEIVSWLLA